MMPGPLIRNDAILRAVGSVEGSDNPGLVSRRAVGQLVGAGLVGVLGSAAVSCATRRIPGKGSAQPMTAPQLGIAPTNPAGMNRQHLRTALQRSNRNVELAPGDYRIDNSGPPFLQIRDFAGALVMQPGARLVFTDPTAPGIQFRGGTGALLRGVAATYASRPTGRHAPALGFVQTTDTRIEQLTLTLSAGIGLLFSECHRPSVHGADISDTAADGLHLANCQQAQVRELRTRRTGDDGLAFVNYGARPDLEGGHTATDITVTDSGTRGITVIGESQVTISDFTVNGSYNSAIRVSYEPHLGTHGSRHPHDVTITDGHLDRCGCAPRGTGVGNPEPYAIFHDDPEPMTSVLFRDITIGSVAPGWEVHPATSTGPRYLNTTGPASHCSP